MARATRIALDMALVSLNTVRPAIAKIWGAAKNIVYNTPARPIVNNLVVAKVELALDKVANVLVDKITIFRDSQLPREQKYLEAELEKVKRRMGAAGQSLKPAVGIMWQYLKVESVPPMTQGFFNGPGGKKLEDSVSAAADNFIAGIAGRIKEMDAEEERIKKEKEAAIQAAQDKIKAEAAQRASEAKKAIDDKKAKETEAAAKKAGEDKKAEEKKAEAAKAEKKPDKPKKVPTKK